MSAHDLRERTVAEVAAQQHRVLGLSDLRAIGLSPGSVAHRVRQGRLRREHQGVYVVGGAPLTPAGRRLAAVLACGAGAAVTHRSAAEALDLLPLRGGPTHVTVPNGNGSRSRPGIRVHSRRKLPDSEVVIDDGSRVTSVARTLVDLGDFSSHQELRRAFVRAEQLRVLDMRAVECALEGAGRRRGPRLLRELLTAYDPRWSETRSHLELAMLDLAQRFGLPEPEVNAWLGGRFLVDFLWRDARVVVESDGHEVHGTPTARRDDARRDHALRRSGFRVVRASYRDVTRRPESVAARVIAALMPDSDQ